MTDSDKPGLTRRQFLDASAVGAVGVGLSLGRGAVAAEAKADDAARPGTPAGGAYNILFILTDQERYFDPAELPPGFELPGHRRLQARGVTFTKHQINSAVCTSSRSVIYTGRHIQATGMFDNLDFPWANDLDPAFGTLGTMLGEAGYYAAYKGKWHLSGTLGTHDELALPQESLSRAIERYGFRDYVGIGDVIGMTQGGYINDETIGTQARRWLRLQGQRFTRDDRPWCQAVNLVNPHDVMFYNTDVPGQHVQDRPPTLMEIAREPDISAYRRQWDVRLPESRHQPFDAPGRPPAHWEYQRGRGALVGNFPNEDPRWRRLLNYYFNCILETDRVIASILDELEELGLAERTIVVVTSDHGELAGSHGAHGKGATCYREQNQVPLIIAHPGYPATHGQRCAALTSHLDLLPSLLSWTGADAATRARFTRDLRGRDLTPLLAKGAGAAVDEVRPATLYCFNMLAYVDADLLTRIQAYLNAGGARDKLAEQGFKPDLTKRGAIRSLFDGRYKYSRYFSPREHNQPRTLEGIYTLNDVELFDLDSDPDERRNLAVAPGQNDDLVLAMNDKMNALIEAELDQPDDGSFLPGGEADWAATTFDP